MAAGSSVDADELADQVRLLTRRAYLETTGPKSGYDVSADLPVEKVDRGLVRVRRTVANCSLPQARNGSHPGHERSWFLGRCRQYGTQEGIRLYRGKPVVIAPEFPWVTE